jgi:epoxyqueuosine reductase
MLDYKKEITDFAKNIGFDVVAFTIPQISATNKQALYEYIANGYYGDMNWLATNNDRRENPQNIFQEAKSVIVFGHNYAPDYNPIAKLENKTIANISCYAGNQDYHDVIKKKLKQVAGFMAQKFSCEVKVFVDTAPILEKPLAQEAGLGWQGKHGCIVSRKFGSWLFLSEIFTTLEITAEEPHKNHCGSCRKCLDICPTNAFIAPYKMDARKCISYLTIEHKGQIPLEYRKAIGNRIYGCDDCLAICPWNNFATKTQEIAYHTRKELQSPLLSDLVQLDDYNFRKLFSKSPVKRIGRNRFIRNVLVAIGNSQDKSLISKIVPLLNDENALIREMAKWAIDELYQSQ